ncbi:MAG: hypothetical protein PUG68_06865, partial [Lachnospiraceae bacterium]|nr:hypothetical protein [Lachnospiraceae bacterium]MDY2760241.1 hypothetical protein [Lachnospiraceae bacterium]
MAKHELNERDFLSEQGKARIGEQILHEIMAGDAPRFSAGVPGVLYNIVDFHKREIFTAQKPFKRYDL